MHLQSRDEKMRGKRQGCGNENEDEWKREERIGENITRMFFFYSNYLGAVRVNKRGPCINYPVHNENVLSSL